MGSSGKKRTTMAKLQRENRLRERRMEKAARKDARKRAAADAPEGVYADGIDGDGVVREIEVEYDLELAPEAPETHG